MSQVRKVKGVSPNYMQFLWLSIGGIRKAQSEGDFPTALQLLSSLIDYLPDDFKDEFGSLAEKMQNSLNLIGNCQIKTLQNEPDFFMRDLKRDSLMSTYARKALTDFIRKLSAKLDEKGYYEVRSHTPEGRSHTLEEELDGF